VNGKLPTPFSCLRTGLALSALLMLFAPQAEALKHSHKQHSSRSSKQKTVAPSVPISASFVHYSGAAGPETAELLGARDRIAAMEKAVPGLRSGTEARLIFADTDQPRITDRAILYFHGFSASPPETSPLVETLAEHEHANAYLPRYSGHGIEGKDGMRGTHLEDWQLETRAALDFGRKLGKHVVVVATSTGATLVVPELIRDPRNVEAVVLISPNFGITTRSAELLLLPWGIGRWLGHLVSGPYRSFQPANAEQGYFWTTTYPIEAVVEVMRAVDLARKAPVENLKLPTLVAYSPADDVIDVPAALSVYDRIGAAKKALLKVPQAENRHVIAGRILSPSGTPVILRKIEQFLHER
jgi:esterase/lipase